METKVQEEVVNKLEKRGFRVNTLIRGNEPNTVAVLMSKKVGRTTTLMAEVEADGLVNGESYNAFAKWVGKR